MPDTTVNRGYRIPKSDGTDPLVPDDVRVPITSIDTDMNKALTNAAAVLYKTGEVSSLSEVVVGTVPPADTPKIIVDINKVVNVSNSAGAFTVDLGAGLAFPNGITHITFTSGDSTSPMAFALVDPTTTKQLIKGKAFTAAGTVVGNGVSVRVMAHIVGW